jgi:uncharacterized membrane protein
VRSCTHDEQPIQSPFHVPMMSDHAITPYRREGTNWVNRSLAFYNSLRNRKNKFVSLLRLALEELKEFVFLNWQPKTPPLVIYYMGICSISGVFSLDKINENMQWKVVALLLIAWSNGTLWMVGFLLHACTCVNSNLVADCLS